MKYMGSPVAGTSEAVYTDSEPLCDEFPMPKDYKEAFDWYMNAMKHKQTLHRENFILQTKLDDTSFEISRLKDVIHKGVIFLRDEVDK